MSSNKDVTCARVIALRPDMAISWYLMASYLHYHDGTSILSNAMFKKLHAEVVENWPILSHPHKHLLAEAAQSPDALTWVEASDYPEDIRKAAVILRSV